MIDNISLEGFDTLILERTVQGVVLLWRGLESSQAVEEVQGGSGKERVRPRRRRWRRRRR